MSHRRVFYGDEFGRRAGVYHGAVATTHILTDGDDTRLGTLEDGWDGSVGEDDGGEGFAGSHLGAIHTSGDDECERNESCEDSGHEDEDGRV